MANTVTSQTLVDGSKNTAIHVYLASDGVSGELSNQVIVDASALAGAPTDLKIDRIMGHITGFSAVLKWDATTDVPFLAISDGGHIDFDYREVGGLQNNAGTGKTGDIMVDTTGFTAAGDAGAITIILSKS